ncbi:MAG: hypothetical protein ACK4HE_01090 [Chitinophagaceae bacterium]
MMLLTTAFKKVYQLLQHSFKSWCKKHNNKDHWSDNPYLIF